MVDSGLITRDGSRIVTCARFQFCSRQCASKCTGCTPTILSEGRIITELKPKFKYPQVAETVQARA